MKKHIGFILFFTAIVAIFLGKLFFLKYSFLSGDYAEQFYPWSKIYSSAIKNFAFPFWTRYFHCGFPLMAEGQIGGFYPLNIIMFFLLPLKVAYNYSIILHFALAGIFTYMLSRKLGASQLGGCLSSLTFCFGSAYAGCFYNIITLKTLTWFALVLLLIEFFTNSKKYYFIILAGLIAGMQFLAGFIQMAVYAFTFYIIYLLYSSKLKSIKPSRVLLSTLLFGLSCVLVALVQLALTIPLAQESARNNCSLGFALWKSFPIPFVISTIIPYWFNFFGHVIFIGTLSLLFIIYALGNLKRTPSIKPILVIAIVSLFASFGKYNPLYVLFIKSTGLFSFRNPSKFLFFTAFSMSILAGIGFSKFFEQENEKHKKYSSIIFAWLLGIGVTILFAGRFALTHFKETILQTANNYVKQNIFAKPYHRHTLDTYIDKAQTFYNELLKNSDPTNIFVLVSLVMIVIATSISIYTFLRPQKINFLKIPLFCLVFIDLFAFSFYGTGFRSNIKPFSYLEPTHKQILNIIKSDNTLYRIFPFGLENNNMPSWCQPNSNIIHEIDSIGAYTPLVNSEYKNTLSDLEVVNDSLGLLMPKKESILEKHSLLKLLNVKYIISCEELNYDFLKHLYTEENVFLYELTDTFPRVFFTPELENLKPSTPQSLEYKDGYAKIKISTNQKGYLVFLENYSKGWEVFVDGEKQKIIKFKNIIPDFARMARSRLRRTNSGIIQAIEIKEGNHNIVFIYQGMSD